MPRKIYALSRAKKKKAHNTTLQKQCQEKDIAQIRVKKKAPNSTLRYLCQGKKKNERKNAKILAKKKKKTPNCPTKTIQKKTCRNSSQKNHRKLPYKN